MWAYATTVGRYMKEHLIQPLTLKVQFLLVSNASLRALLCVWRRFIILSVFYRQSGLWIASPLSVDLSPCLVIKYPSPVPLQPCTRMHTCMHAGLQLPCSQLWVSIGEIAQLAHPEVFAHLFLRQRGEPANYKVYMPPHSLAQPCGLKVNGDTESKAAHLLYPVVQEAMNEPQTWSVSPYSFHVGKQPAVKCDEVMEVFSSSFVFGSVFCVPALKETTPSPRQPSDLLLEVQKPTSWCFVSRCLYTHAHKQETALFHVPQTACSLSSSWKVQQEKKKMFSSHVHLVWFAIRKTIHYIYVMKTQYVENCLRKPRTRLFDGGNKIWT